MWGIWGWDKGSRLAEPLPFGASSRDEPGRSPFPASIVTCLRQLKAYVGTNKVVCYALEMSSGIKARNQSYKAELYLDERGASLITLPY